MTTDRPTSPAGFLVEAEPKAVSAARYRIIALVRSWDVPLSEDALNDLELLSSEVITNAVRYTGAACTVVVRWTGVRVRVEVTDVDPVRPSPRDASPEAEGGRGLLLIESLAAAWGSAPDPAGKVVWFEAGPADETPPPPAPGRQLTEQVRTALPFPSSAHQTMRRRLHQLARPTEVAPLRA